MRLDSAACVGAGYHGQHEYEPLRDREHEREYTQTLQSGGVHDDTYGTGTAAASNSACGVESSPAADVRVVGFAPTAIPTPASHIHTNASGPQAHPADTATADVHNTDSHAALSQTDSTGPDYSLSAAAESFSGSAPSPIFSFGTRDGRDGGAADRDALLSPRTRWGGGSEPIATVQGEEGRRRRLRQWVAAVVTVGAVCGALVTIVLFEALRSDPTDAGAAMGPPGARDWLAHYLTIPDPTHAAQHFAFYTSRQSLAGSYGK